MRRLHRGLSASLSRISALLPPKSNRPIPTNLALPPSPLTARGTHYAASSGYKGLVFGAQRAADSAYDATASARHGAAAAYSTAAGAASKVTDAASKAAEAVTGTAKHAADAVTGTAKHAAEAAAEAASKAAQAAKETAGGAYESVAGAVGAH